MGDKSKDEIGIKLLQSLLQNDSFDVSKQYFYYADTKENYNNNIVKDTFLSFDQYNIFIKEASNLNGGVVRVNISKDSKICYIDENKNINAEIEKAKSEGYDFAIVNNNNKYEYVILNKDKIFNKTFLSIDEAKKECSELEKQYNEMTKKITGVTSFSNENNKTVTYSQNDYSKKEQSKISDTLKEYGLIEESDSISNKDELIKGIDQIKKLNTEFNVDIGSLELAIERLQNIDVNSFYSSLVNAEKLLSALDLKVSNNCLTEVINYVQSNLQNSETGSDKAKSYLNKLNQLKKTLSSNNSNYEIEKYKSLLANIDNFADDLGLSSIEKRNMVQENSEALMTLIRPQIEKMEELSLGTTGRGKKILLYDNNNTLDYLESLYAYAKNSNIYYDNVALGEIVEKRIKGENLSLDEQSFLLNEHSNVAFEVLAQINYLTDNALTKEENEWYNQNISKFSDIDIKFLDIGMTQLSYQISSGERLSIDKQTFFDQNKEGWNERSKYKLEKAQTQYDSLVNNKNMTRINVTHSNIKENELDYGYYVYYITDDGKYVTEQEYKEEVARVNKINYSNSEYVSGKKIDLLDETVLEQPTIKEVKIASAFDMLSETDQYVVGGNIQYNRQYFIGLANDVNNCNALLSEINGRINNIKNAMDDVISIQSVQSDEYYDLENHIYAVYGIAHIKSLEDLQTLLNTEVSEEKKLSEKRDNFNKEYLDGFNYYNNELLDIQKGIILKKSISTYTNDDFDFLNIEYPYQQLLMDNNEIELEQIEISGQREDISLDVTFENLKHFFINGIASIGDGFETLKAISDKTFFNEYYNENVLKGGYTYSKRWAESLEESNPTLSKERKLCERSLELTNRRNSNDQKMHMLTSRNLDFEEYANNYRIKAYEVENGMYYTFYSDEAKTQKIEVDTSEFAMFLKSQGVDELEGWVYIDKNGKYERVDKKVNNELYSMQQYDDYKLAADIINYDYNKHVIDLKDWTNEEFNNYLKEKMDIGNRLGGMKIAEQWACKTDKYGKPYVYGRSFVNGLNQWWNGMQNLFSADGVVNSNDYACMYYTQILSADYSTIDAMADEIITSIGNMAPSIAIQLAVTALAYFCPPSAGIALALMQNASTLSMGLSATGNAREQALQQGLNNSQAWLYGILTGSSEALLERVLGGIRGLSMDPNLEKRLLSKAIGEYFESGFGGFISDMFSEGLEESIQEILDPVFKGLATGNYDAIDWNAVFKSGIYGAITSGVMNVGHVGISNSIGAISYLTTGSSIGLTTLIGKYSGGKLIADFDLFKADFGAVTKARKNGTLSDTITKLSNSTDVQTQYDAYVKEYEELEKNTKNKENLGKMQTKNEFVEALAIEAITSSENIELNLKFVERDLNNKRLELESINKQIETETNEQAKTKLQKKAESLQGEVVSLLAQQSRFNQIKILGNDYSKIALLSSNPLMNLLTEIIRAEQETSEEVDEKKTGYKIDDNGEIVRDVTSGEIIEDLRGEDIPIFTPPADTETDTIVEVEKVKDFYEKNKNIFDKFSNNKEKREIIKEKFGEFRDYIYGTKTLNAEETAQYFDLDYSEYLFNNYKIDPFNPEIEIRNILQHIDFSKIFNSFDSGVSKIQDYLLMFMINNNVLNINSLTKNMSVELAINYFGNIYLENEKIKFTDILNCLPSDAILPFVVKFKNNLSDEEICNFIRQIHDSSYIAFSHESQHQVIFDDELVKKLFEIDVIHDYLIRRIGSRYFYGLVESYNLSSELLIQRELLLKSVLNNADSYSFSEIRETIADLYFHNGVLPVKLDLETILFMANKDITFRNEILGDDYLYLSKLYNYFTNDIDFRNLDLDLSKGKEMIEKYFSQCQDRFKDLMVEKIEQNPTENLTPEILVSSNGKNVMVYSLENQTETQKHFTFLVSTINPNSEYIKAQDAIDFKEKYYSSQNIEAFKGYRCCSLINEQSLECIFSPHRGIVFGYTNLDGRNIISANYGDARTDNPNFVKYGRVNKSNFDTIESFVEHTQGWNEITVSKAENINAMQPSYIYVTSAPTQFQIDVAAEFGIPIIYVNKESYMQQKMLPRENASYYGWGEDFIKTTKIDEATLKTALEGTNSSMQTIITNLNEFERVLTGNQASELSNINDASIIFVDGKSKHFILNESKVMYNKVPEIASSRQLFGMMQLEAINNTYIPIYNENGTLLFSEEQFNKMRKGMSGIAEYETGDYEFSDNLEFDALTPYLEKIDENIKAVETKRKPLVDEFTKIMNGLGLTVTLGTNSGGDVELVEAGSTMRGTNIPNLDGSKWDFDFTVRLDEKNVWKVKEALETKFHAEGHITQTSKYKVRLTDVTIPGLDTTIDVDFSLTPQKENYLSTEDALSVRLNNMKETDPQKYRLVLANIMYAKDYLKHNGAYKPSRSIINGGDRSFGGLGGVGIENWILQNGGSFIDASMDFLSHAQGKDFMDFQKEYAIIDPGKNHVEVSKHNFPYDNFIMKNMRYNGYNTMVEALKAFVDSTLIDIIQESSYIPTEFCKNPFLFRKCFDLGDPSLILQFDESLFTQADYDALAKLLMDNNNMYSALYLPVSDEFIHRNFKIITEYIENQSTISNVLAKNQELLSYYVSNGNWAQIFKFELSDEFIKNHFEDISKYMESSKAICDSVRGNQELLSYFINTNNWEMVLKFNLSDSFIHENLNYIIEFISEENPYKWGSIKKSQELFDYYVSKKTEESFQILWHFDYSLFTEENISKNIDFFLEYINYKDTIFNSKITSSDAILNQLIKNKDWKTLITKMDVDKVLTDQIISENFEAIVEIIQNTNIIYSKVLSNNQELVSWFIKNEDWINLAKLNITDEMIEQNFETIINTIKSSYYVPEGLKKNQKLFDYFVQNYFEIGEGLSFINEFDNSLFSDEYIKSNLDLFVRIVNDRAEYQINYVLRTNEFLVKYFLDKKDFTNISKFIISDEIISQYYDLFIDIVKNNDSEIPYGVLNNKNLLLYFMNDIDSENVLKFDESLFTSSFINENIDKLIKIVEKCPYNSYSDNPIFSNKVVFDTLIAKGDFQSIFKFDNSLFTNEFVQENAVSLYNAYVYFYNNGIEIKKPMDCLGNWIVEKSGPNGIIKLNENLTPYHLLDMLKIHMSENFIKENIVDISNYLSKYNIEESQFFGSNVLFEHFLDEKKYDIASKCIGARALLFGFNSTTNSFLNKYFDAIVSEYGKLYDSMNNSKVLKWVIESGRIDAVKLFDSDCFTEEIMNKYNLYDVIKRNFNGVIPENLINNPYLVIQAIKAGDYDFAMQMSAAAILFDDGFIQNISYDGNIEEVRMHIANLLDTSVKELNDKINKLAIHNDEILGTLNIKLLGKKYDKISLDLIEKFSPYIDIQRKILELGDNSLSILVRTMDMLDFKEYDVCPIINNFLNNYQNYSELLGTINIDNISQEQLHNLLIIMQNKDNYLNIKDASQLTNENYISIKKNHFNEIELRIKNSEIGFEELKQEVFIKRYGMSIEQVELLLNRYCKNIDLLRMSNLDERIVNLLNDLYLIYNSDNFQLLQYYYIGNAVFEDFYSAVCLESKIRSNFAQLFNDAIYKVRESDKVDSSRFLDPNYDGPVPEFYMPQDDANFQVTVLGAYSHYTVPANFKEEWNQPKIASHGICTSFIGTDQIATARDTKAHPIYGFSGYENGALLLQGNYDLVSREANTLFNASYGKTTNASAFYSPQDLINNTRHTHNETVLERRNLDSSKEEFKRQPDYIVYIVDDVNNADNFNLNNSYYTETLQAAKDHGVPIVVVDRLFFAKKETAKCNEMMKAIMLDKSFDVIDDLIVKYMNNMVGCRHYEGKEVKEYNYYFTREGFNKMYNDILNYAKELDSESRKKVIGKLRNALVNEAYKISENDRSAQASGSYYSVLGLSEKVNELNKIIVDTTVAVETATKTDYINSQIISDYYFKSPDSIKDRIYYDIMNNVSDEEIVNKINNGLYSI